MSDKVINYDVLWLSKLTMTAWTQKTVKRKKKTGTSRGVRDV